MAWAPASRRTVYHRNHLRRARHVSNTEPIRARLSAHLYRVVPGRVLVFVVSLSLSWAAFSRGQVCQGGQNYCMYYTKNPCNGTVACQPTGPGYQCLFHQLQVTEGYWSLTIANSTHWPLCFWPATLTTMNCTEEAPACGTTSHYVTGNANCPAANLCYGYWWWNACSGSGDAC